RPADKMPALRQVVLTHCFRVCLSHSRSASIFWRNQIMLSKRAGLWLGLIATLGLLSLGSSCSNKGGGEEGAGTGTQGAAYASKGDEGTISGTIAYTGTAPENPKIDTSADAQCTSKNPNLTAETWAVKDGKVANTFVYIKDGTLADGKKIGDFTGWP